LVYRHNQHQVDDCERLARNLGFTWFRAKVSKRTPAMGLEYPIGWQQPHVDSGPIDCHALRELSAYIDARGRLHPCCWLGDRLDQDPANFSVIQQTWRTNTPESICQRTCSARESGTSFTNQWQRNVALN